MKFTADSDSKEVNIPYLDEARAGDGWQGQATKESIGTLRAQISAEIGQLGGHIIRWVHGTYEINGEQRPGVQIGYQVVGPNNTPFEGRIDVAGLPWQDPYGGDKYHARYEEVNEKKKEQSLAMALYNVREALKSMRILQILSPGYAALVPWLLMNGTDKTLGEMWGIGSPALPAPDDSGDIVDAEFKVVKEDKQ